MYSPSPYRYFTENIPRKRDFDRKVNSLQLANEYIKAMNMRRECDYDHDSYIGDQMEIYDCIEKLDEKISHMANTRSVTKLINELYEEIDSKLDDLDEKIKSIDTIIKGFEERMIYSHQTIMKMLENKQKSEENQ